MRLIILGFTTIFLGFFTLQLFNTICRATNKCNAIILSYYLPKNTGKERYQLFFATNNNSSNILFSTKDDYKITNSGGDIEAIFTAKNLSDKEIKIRPIVSIAPSEATQYIKFYECLCQKEKIIKKGESINLSVKLNLKKEIEKDNFFLEKKSIKIIYTIESN